MSALGRLLLSLRGSNQSNLGGCWCGDLKSKERQNVCREKARATQPVQRGSLQSKGVPPRYGSAAQLRTTGLWRACEQDFAEFAGCEEVGRS